MSTRINVNIGDGGLLDRNAQQQAAARQANQQRASADKTAVEGQRQLEQERIRKGLDPVTGRPLAIPPSSASAGSSSRIQRIDQEPAANRQLTECDAVILYCPTQEVLDTSPTVPGASFIPGNFDSYLLPVLCKPKNAKLRVKQPAIYDEKEYPYTFGLTFTTVPRFNEPSPEVFLQTFVSAPTDPSLQKRLEWSNYTGQFTAFDFGVHPIPLKNPARVEFTLEFDVFIPQSTASNTSNRGELINAKVTLLKNIAQYEKENSDVLFFVQIPSAAFNLGLESTSSVNIASYDITIDLFQPTQEFYGESSEFVDVPPRFVKFGWNRCALTYSDGKFSTYLDGKVFRSVNLPRAKINSTYEGVVFNVDAETSHTMPAVSAVRYIEKDLYKTADYEPKTLIGRIP
jgi:hypothetical protein